MKTHVTTLKKYGSKQNKMRDICWQDAGVWKEWDLPNWNMVDLVSAPEAEAVVTNKGLAWSKHQKRCMFLKK